MPGSREPTAYLIAHVRDALAHHPGVAALDLSVRIVGQDAYVSGSVTTVTRRDVCDAVVRELLPDHTVHNQLVVLEPRVPSGAEDVR
jgi:formaldehyde-activating enzyme involved in methanogenesis